MAPLPLQGGIVTDALNRFVEGVARALPRVFAGLVFLALAALLVRSVLAALRWALARAMAGEPSIYRQFLVTIVAVFLWFAVGLSFLSVVGLEGIAASLGTAAGFLALGVSYAVSGAIADAVAGVYLLRDPDFNPGDRVEAAGVTGVVRTIELRKTRFAVDGDTVVRGNAEIEKKWTLLEAGAGVDPDAGGADPESDPAG